MQRRGFPFWSAESNLPPLGELWKSLAMRQISVSGEANLDLRPFGIKAVVLHAVAATDWVGYIDLFVLSSVGQYL